MLQVTYPRTANNEKELSVVRGEFLEVLDDSRKWWKTRNIHGQVAHVPHTIVAEAGGGGDRGKAGADWIHKEKMVARKGAELRYF